MKQLKYISFFKQVITASVVFISRLNILPANVSPLGSFGFFGNPLLYGVSIIAFDLLVKGLYKGFLFTYVGFVCYALLGKISQNKLKRQVILLPLASFLFFLISNFGVWLYWYEHTFANLLLCYLVAVPFYTKTLLGDLFFGYSYLFAINVNRFKSSSRTFASFVLQYSK